MRRRLLRAALKLVRVCRRDHKLHAPTAPGEVEVAGGGGGAVGMVAAAAIGHGHNKDYHS